MLKVKLYLFVVFIAFIGIAQAQEHGTINPFSKGVYNSENYIFPRDTTLAFNIGINYDPLGLSAGAYNVQYWHRPVPNNNNVYWAFTSNSNLVHGIVLASDMDGTIYQGGIRMYFNAMRIWTGNSQNTGYFELNGNTGQPTFSYFNTAGILATTSAGVVSSLPFGLDAFSGSATSDTVLVSGVSDTSIVFLTIKDISPIAADELSFTTSTDTLFVHRPAGTTSDLPYSYIIVKK